MTRVVIRDIRKTYKLGRVNVPVLKGVSLDCKAGECLAILGASGSGKSTLLHLIGGLDSPDSGEGSIQVGDEVITSLGAAKLNTFRAEQVGFVFQFYHLLPELSVTENVLIARMVKDRMGYFKHAGEARTEAERLLQTMGLGHRLKHRPGELSGGERQRVAIARALVNRPKLFLADEPTGNLDRETGQKILDAMMSVRRETGQTMVIVTHDPETASRADRVIQIKDGVVATTDGQS